MKFGEMLGFTKRFKEINESKAPNKDVRLANLMTDLEQAYEIPMFSNEQFKANNPHVISMYLTVSEARSF